MRDLLCDVMTAVGDEVFGHFNAGAVNVPVLSKHTVSVHSHNCVFLELLVYHYTASHSLITPMHHDFVDVLT